MRRARPSTVLATLAVLCAAALPACASDDGLVTEPPSDAFCDAVVALEDRLPRTPYITTDEWIALFEPVAAHAPDPVKADAELFLDGLRRVESEPGLRDQPRFREASERVQRYATAGCGLHESDSPF